MIWKPCQLQVIAGQERDELGNVAGGTWQTVKETVCRYSPWTEEQIALEGREVTRNEQRFVIPIPFEAFPFCTHAVLNGIRQEIIQRIDLSSRYTIIQVKVYKGKGVCQV